MITAAADGSSLNNPGPAGWAWYVDDDRWAAGGWAHGTNNMGELMAVLDLLRQTAPAGEELHVLCDSQYVINAVTRWMTGWKRKGWRKADGKPVLNVELLKQLDAELADRVVTFEWVKGHAGHAMNEAADERARAAALAYKEGRTPDAGPGFGAGPAASRTVEADPYWPEQDGLFGVEDEAPSDADQVIAGERALLSDDVRADQARLGALLHPDFVEHSSSGRLWSREDVLAELGPLPEPVELEVLGVDVLGPDALLLRWRAHASRTVLRSSVWVRQGGRWRLRFHQGTVLPDGA